MKTLNLKESLNLINTEDNLLILDVRTSEEYSSGHIVKSKSLPLAKLQFDLDKILDFEEKPILVYCEKGGRSFQACEILEDNGFTKVFNLEGGFSKFSNYNLSKGTCKKF